MSNQYMVSIVFMVLFLAGVVYVVSRRRRGGGSVKSISIGGLGVVLYSGIDDSTAAEIGDALLRTKESLWCVFEEAYGIPANYFLDSIEIAPGPWDDEFGHRGAVLSLGYRKMKVELGGYRGYSENHWFGGELHNLYRNKIGRPYTPAQDEMDAFRRCTSAWMSIP